MTNIEIIKMLINALDTNGVSEEANKQAALALLDNLKVAPKKDAAVPENKETKKQGIKQGNTKIDPGKIVALHEAGWSTAKIADEIGTTTVTVRNHLKKEARQ